MISHVRLRMRPRGPVFSDHDKIINVKVSMYVNGRGHIGWDETVDLRQTDRRTVNGYCNGYVAALADLKKAVGDETPIDLMRLARVEKLQPKEKPMAVMTPQPQQTEAQKQRDQDNEDWVSYFIDALQQQSFIKRFLVLFGLTPYARDVLSHCFRFATTKLEIQRLKRMDSRGNKAKNVQEPQQDG